VTAARKIAVVEDAPALATQAANEFRTRSRAAINERGCFTVAFSGGHTPNAMFELLARPDFADDIDWNNVFVFWGDERCVPPDDPRSNFSAANGRLLQKVPLPPGNVHRMRGELEPREGAIAYSKELEAFFAGATRFDLSYLGLGPDGHTASLFPNSRALGVTDALCTENFAGVTIDPPWRLTLTYPALNASRAILFLVEGGEKADIVARVIEGPRDPRQLPSQGIAPAGELVWLLDRAAASKLTARA
jgi:6-phosphogluconolactonase